MYYSYYCTYMVDKKEEAEAMFYFQKCLYSIVMMGWSLTYTRMWTTEPVYMPSFLTSFQHMEVTELVRRTVMLQIRVREILCSNFFRDTGYSDRDLSWCFSVSLGKFREQALCSNLFRPNTFQFTIHLPSKHSKIPITFKINPNRPHNKSNMLVHVDNDVSGIIDRNSLTLLF